MSIYGIGVVSIFILSSIGIIVSKDVIVSFYIALISIASMFVVILVSKDEGA